MKFDDQEPKAPAEYFRAARAWLDATAGPGVGVW